MADVLERLWQRDDSALYEISGNQSAVKRYLASTPGTRAICNDSSIVGIRYTDMLEASVAETLVGLQASDCFKSAETDTAVLHILRGGLNFGIRKALHTAFDWNSHSSAFISAQRARDSEDPESWHITESNYQKVYLPKEATIIFGDVVATGTSLLFGLKQMLAQVEAQSASVGSFLFFTIGSYKAEEILVEIDADCRARFPNYKGAAVVYLEGRFDVATPESALSIKYTGTDLLRSNALLAPEFIDSQYKNPAFPIERCTIYDAGSRAFWLPEYCEDVREYWQQTAALADDGMSYSELLSERFPKLSQDKFEDVDLSELCRRQLSNEEKIWRMQ